MLFFKQIKAEKLNDPSFKDVYHRECHICGVTLKVIKRIEEMIDAGEQDSVSSLLAELGIPADNYTALKAGDCCRPEQVFQLCRQLNIDVNAEKACPRRD